jgi:hypothetical protein
MGANRRLYLAQVFVLSSSMAACLLAGCSTTQDIAVESGGYAPGGGTGEAEQAAARVIQGLTIDRDSGLAVFALLDGSRIEASLVARDKAEWPSGCPTNIYTHRMEVLDMDQEELAIGPITLANPILARDCPPDPTQVVLREDGEIGNAGGVAGSACSHTDACIRFTPQQDLRWRANGSAEFTDQDHPVTFDILITADDATVRIDPATFVAIWGPEKGAVVSNLEQTGTIREQAGFDTSGASIRRIVDLVTYTPDAGFHGTDAFGFRICGTEGTCDDARVTVTVKPVAAGKTVP